MRILWSFIAILVLATAVVVLVGRDDALLGRVALGSEDSQLRPPTTVSPGPGDGRSSPDRPEPVDETAGASGKPPLSTDPPDAGEAEPVDVDGATPPETLAAPELPAPLRPQAPPSGDVVASGPEPTEEPDQQPTSVAPAAAGGEAVTTAQATPTAGSREEGNEEPPPTGDVPASSEIDREAEALAAELLASADEREPVREVELVDESAATVEESGSATAEESGSATAVPNEPEPEPEPETAGAKPDAMKLVTRDDGSMLIDDRYVVRGKGTRDNPYRITWELLASAQQTYQPRLGMTEIPPRVRMLHDSYIRITGYLAFPLATAQIDEVLVMLNQWDGCCIGVPPSPYDALETRLSNPLDVQRGHLIQYGTVEGKFKVDPYLVNDWLVGLYVLEEARIEMDL